MTPSHIVTSRSFVGEVQVNLRKREAELAWLPLEIAFWELLLTKTSIFDQPTGLRAKYRRMKCLAEEKLLMHRRHRLP